MRALATLRQAIIRLSPWRQYALLWLLGAVTALAFPPFAFWPALIPAFTALLWCITTPACKRRAFACGWWLGFGHFMAGLYWISIALLTDPSQYGWMIPFALFGIAAVLAIYTGIASWITALIPLQGAPRKTLVLAASWVIMELARSVLLTGFPWNLAGYVWTGSVAMMQIASLTGIEGLSFLAIVMAGICSTLAIEDTNGSSTTGSIRPLCLTLLLLALVWGGGYLRLPAPADYPPTNVMLRLIQPNITQDHKWKPELRFNTLKRHVDLSMMAAANPVQFLIWPEAAIPYSLEPHSDLIHYIQKVIPPHGFLLTGALREEGDDNNYRLWNSVFAIDAKGDIPAFYDKVHLVPFGEYIPFRALLPINKITYGTTDFSSGPAPQTLSPSLHSPAFGVLICYEAIFPTHIIDQRQRPSWLLNVTNDAWFGTSTGPYQHFEMVRMRSIEQGLPLVRAANTGISAIIDAYGQITGLLPLGAENILDGVLPAALTPTPYSYYGNYIILLIIYSLGMFLFLTQPSEKSNDERY